MIILIILSAPSPTQPQSLVALNYFKALQCRQWEAPPKPGIPEILRPRAGFRCVGKDMYYNLRRLAAAVGLIKHQTQFSGDTGPIFDHEALAAFDAESRRMSDSLNIKNTFIASLDRCLATDGFMEIFYQRFTARSPAVRARFARTDMTVQAQRFADSLRTLASAVAGEPAGLRELALRAESHGQRGMNITPDIYELWSAAIIATAKEYDREWTVSVEQAWVQTVEIAVKYMTNRF